MSRICMTLPNTLLDELIKVIPAKNKTEAVVKAITDQIKTKKKEKLKAMAGKMEFTKEADELRHKDKRIG